MSIECAECERDLRVGHADDCPLHPDNRKKTIIDLRKELTAERQRAEKAEAELALMKKSFPYCDEHAPSGGSRSGCLECAWVRANYALSKISYLCGEPNEMEYSAYDADYDAPAVIKQVEAVKAELAAVREDAKRYRWLREHVSVWDGQFRCYEADKRQLVGGPAATGGQRLDAAIDAARKP